MKNKLKYFFIFSLLTIFIPTAVLAHLRNTRPQELSFLCKNYFKRIDILNSFTATETQNFKKLAEEYIRIHGKEDPDSQQIKRHIEVQFLEFITLLTKKGLSEVRGVLRSLFVELGQRLLSKNSLLEISLSEHHQQKVDLLQLQEKTAQIIYETRKQGVPEAFVFLCKKGDKFLQKILFLIENVILQDTDLILKGLKIAVQNRQYQTSDILLNFVLSRSVSPLQLSKIFVSAGGFAKREFLQKMLDAGVDIDVHDPITGYTALIHASQYNSQVDVVKFLLEQGANLSETVNTRNKKRDFNTGAEGHSALFAAVHEHALSNVELLLQAGAQDIQQDAEYGYTALLYAVEYAKTDVVKLFIKYNMNLNVRGREGETPLIVAAKSVSPNRLEVAELLLNENVDIEAQDNNGKKALAWAVDCRNNELVRLILRFNRMKSSP